MKNLAIIILFLSSLNISAQNKGDGTAEAIGGGVIDFLLKNPKTAKNIDETGEAALNSLGNILNVLGKRKHQVKVANSGKDEITINNNIPGQSQKENSVTVHSERGASKFLMDEKGNVYLIHQGKVYPLAETLIEQARNKYASENSFGNRNLSPRGKTEIQKEYDLFLKRKADEQSGFVKFQRKEYIVPRKMYISELAKRLGEKPEKITIKRHVRKRGRDIVYGDPEIRSIKRGKKKLKKGSKVEYYSENKIIRKKVEVSILFTYTWLLDEGTDLKIENFQGIKNQFFEEESFGIASFIIVPKSAPFSNYF